jgi:tRNA dimethylallyltransferase
MKLKTYPPLEGAWFLTGATATGKTGVGLELAEALGAEIISLDSMAVYRGMNVGTAKPSAEEQARVRHHLIDIVEPNQDYSLSEYVEVAHSIVRDLRDQDKTPIFVGGTPLYLKSLLRGFFPGPPADWEFRNQIEEEIQEVGIDALYKRLRQVDPLAADRLHPHDKRRIVRALEVNKLTGRPLSHEQTQFDELPPSSNCRVFTLVRPRKVLHMRIEARVASMFSNGLVAEVKGLLERWGSLSRTAVQAVGYREVVDHVREERELTGTIELVTARTRQFARRQETWFRSLAECQPLTVNETESPGTVAERIRTATGADR